MDSEKGSTDGHMASAMGGGDDDDVARDPGAQSTFGTPNYADDDTEGHRAHTVYCTYGFHMPSNNYRRRGHHRRHRHKNVTRKREDGTLTSELPPDRPVTPPAERVQFILGEEDCGGEHESHPLFSEMEELCVNGDDIEWKETARWIKFEEDVEEGGDRWSKPHVATISLHSLFELRSCILTGTVLLDLEGTSLDQIADLVLENMVNSGVLTVDIKANVKEALLRRHRHQHEKRHDKSKLPLIRSLADIGKNSSKSMFGSHTTNHDSGLPNSPSVTSLHNHSHSQPNTPQSGLTVNGTETNASSTSDLQHRLNQAFMRKIPPGSEADNILVGEIDFLDRAISAFVRLNQACHLGDLTEVPVPTRFLFILLGPHSIPGRYHEVGRAMATLMSDEVFHDVAYKARNREDLLAGVDEFLDAVTILPPGAWDPSIRIEPPTQIPSQDARKKHEVQETKHESSDDEEEKEREANGLKITGRLFGGLINDIKRKKRWYFSDLKDALALQSIASIFFLYFACLTPIITFGGLLGDATGNYIATIESLVSGLICGLIYGFFSGQPLTILGSTGPVLVFETILYDFCKDHDYHYLNIRLWIGIWISIVLMLLVAFDASALVCYITRFTEENFASLISFIFIVSAFQKVYEINSLKPLELIPGTDYNYTCYCQFPNETSRLIREFNDSSTDILKKCIKNFKGELIGDGCKAVEPVPNVFLLSVVLFAATYVIAIMLKEFKSSSFFGASFRSLVSDFAVVIAISSMTLIDMLIGLDTPKLEVPTDFKPTNEDRGWIAPLFHEKNPWYVILLTPIPALLATILIFMDQQITAVIINRKENKLKKGCGYHLDLCVLSVLIAINSLMGLPWFVAATVLSMTHVMSLRMESECSAPGEKPRFLGVREQRVTHICIFLLVGLSMFFTPILRCIPMPILYGVFLYMGTSSLKGSQFFDRVLIMFMPQKYQPDYMFLRYVPTSRVHLFTIIQLACFVGLWVVKSTKPISISFPVMLVVIIGVRKLLDFVFTRAELKLLDDIMPEHIKRSREEEKLVKQKEEEEKTGGKLVPNASSGNVNIPLANGNILKIPMDKFSTNQNQSPAMNITEQLAKSNAWKSINIAGNGNKDKNQQINGKNKRGNKKDAKTEEEQKRLSIMPEEDDEEDCGITIRVDAPTPIPPAVTPTRNSPQEDRSETSV